MSTGRRDTVILSVAIVIAALLLSAAICFNAVVQMGWGFPFYGRGAGTTGAATPTETVEVRATLATATRPAEIATPSPGGTVEVRTTLVATSVPTGEAGIGGRVEDAPLGVSPGMPAPVFSLPTLDGQEVTIGGPGRPIVLNFWASWCPECGPEYPVIESIPALYGDVVDVWTVNWRESAEQVQEYFRRQGVELPVLLDADGEVTTSLYVVRWIPTTVFIDADGIVRWIQVGGLTPEVLDEAIALIVPETGVPPITPTGPA